MKKIISTIAIGLTIAFTQPQINKAPADDFQVIITHRDIENNQHIDAVTYEAEKQIYLDGRQDYEVEIKTIRKISLETIIRDLQILTGGQDS